MKAAKRRSSTGQIWVVAGLGTLFVGLLIAANIWSSQNKASGGPATIPVVATDKELNAVGTTKGKPDAKAHLVEYGDFLCPACGFMFQNLEPEFQGMIDKGELRFTQKDFVLDGHRPYAQWAAEAAYCAADQDKFWAYRALLYSNQKQWTKGDLKQYAKDLTLDTAAFNQCFDSGKHTDTVNKSTQEAKDLNLPGTPTYLINGEMLDLGQFRNVAEFMTKLTEEVKKANGQ